MSDKSFSKGIRSEQGGGHVLDLKPKVSLMSLWLSVGLNSKMLSTSYA